MNSLFDEATHQDILAIPLTRVEEEDKVIWKANKVQDFSIKSAYQVVLRHINTMERALILGEIDRPKTN